MTEAVNMYLRAVYEITRNKLNLMVASALREYVTIYILQYNLGSFTLRRKYTLPLYFEKDRVYSGATNVQLEKN